MTLKQELKKTLVESPYVDLLVVDGTVINEELMFRFTNTSDSSVGFGGKEFIPFPYKLSEMEVTTGQPPRPKLVIANVTHLIQPMVQKYQDLKNVKVIRYRTLAKFLDNGPAADPSQTLPPEVYYINAIVRMDRTSIEFELVTALDLPNARLPAAQALKDDLGTNDLYAPGLSMVRFRG